MENIEDYNIYDDICTYVRIVQQMQYEDDIDILISWLNTRTIGTINLLTQQLQDAYSLLDTYKKERVSAKHELPN